MKTKISLCTGILLGLLITTACSHKGNNTNNQISFSTLKLDTVAHLFGDTAKPACHFSLDLQYPTAAKDEKELTSLQYIFSEAYFGADYSKISPVVAAPKYMENYVKNYRNLEQDYNLPVNEELDGWEMASYSYEENLSSQIKFNSNDFISFCVNEYSFTGGAHGMYNTINHVIDLNSKSLLYLEDIFAISSLPDIGKLIIETIAADRKYKNPTELNDDGFFSIDEVQPTKNFTIDEKGITWIYNPYEIAVYAAGQITVTLEWPLVKPYLIDNSPVMKLASTNEK